MSSWGTKRRNFIITIFLSITFVVVAILAYLFFYEAPSCFDNKQNADEKGIDCGGICDILCTNQTLEPLVKWTRYFEVIPGLYNVVAYLENQNVNAGTDNMEYKFTIYDKNSTILSEKTGSIKLRPKEIIPITVSGLTTGKLQAARVSFEITNDVVWNKSEIRNLIIQIKEEQLVQRDGAPRVSAVLENVGFETVKDIDTIVILYNSEGNAVGVSSTYTPEIGANNRVNIVFTWPQNFSEQVSRFEIIPLYDTK